jgi:predicted TIM-barrel fold metal-dependent hydrolase
MRKTDAHMHINFRSIDHSSIIKHLDRNRIDKCWLHTWEESYPAIPSFYSSFPPDEVFAVFEKYPQRIVPFYAPDPASGNIREKFDSYMQRGLKGCGELKVSMDWDSPLIKEYLDIVTELKLPLLFHMEPPKSYYIPERGSVADRVFALLVNGAFNGTTGYYIRKIAQRNMRVKSFLNAKSILFPGYLFNFSMLEKRIAEYPDTIFIGHGPGFWNNISAVQSDKYFYQKGKYDDFGIIDRLLDNYGNLYCDISGRGALTALRCDKTQTSRFLKKHYSRVLFGTDNIDTESLERIVVKSGLSKSEIERIFHANAMHIAG